MLTENVLLALITAISAVAVIIVLIVVVRYGFRVEVGWLYFKMYADAPRAVNKKEINRLIEESVTSEIEQHLSAMESYKDAMVTIDNNMRALIAHRISDISIPPLPGDDFTRSHLLAVSMKLELLILNSENHYFTAMETPEKLQSYLTEKYARFLRVFNQYSKNQEFVRRSSLVVLAGWWDVVRPSLITTISQKMSFLETSKLVFPDNFWRVRMTDVVEKYRNIIDCLDDELDLTVLVCDYLRESYVSPTTVYKKTEGGNYVKDN